MTICTSTFPGFLPGAMDAEAGLWNTFAAAMTGNAGPKGTSMNRPPPFANNAASANGNGGGGAAADSSDFSAGRDLMMKYLGSGKFSRSERKELLGYLSVLTGEERFKGWRLRKKMRGGIGALVESADTKGTRITEIEDRYFQIEGAFLFLHMRYVANASNFDEAQFNDELSATLGEKASWTSLNLLYDYHSKHDLLASEQESSDLNNPGAVLKKLFYANNVIKSAEEAAVKADAKAVAAAKIKAAAEAEAKVKAEAEAAAKVEAEAEATIAEAKENISKLKSAVVAARLKERQATVELRKVEAEAKEKIDAANAKKVTTERKISEAKKRMKTAQANVDAAENRLSEIEGKIANLHNLATEADEKANNLKGDLKAAEQNAREADKRRALAEEGFIAALNAQTEAEEGHAAETKNWEDLTQKSADSKEETEAKVAEVKREIESLNEAAEAEIAELDKEIAGLNADVTAAEKKAADAKSERDQTITNLKLAAKTAAEEKLRLHTEKLRAVNASTKRAAEAEKQIAAAKAEIAAINKEIKGLDKDVAAAQLKVKEAEKELAKERKITEAAIDKSNAKARGILSQAGRAFAERQIPDRQHEPGASFADLKRTVGGKTPQEVLDAKVLVEDDDMAGDAKAPPSSAGSEDTIETPIVKPDGTPEDVDEDQIEEIDEDQIEMVEPPPPPTDEEVESSDEPDTDKTPVVPPPVDKASESPDVQDPDGDEDSGEVAQIEIPVPSEELKALLKKRGRSLRDALGLLNKAGKPPDAADAPRSDAKKSAFEPIDIVVPPLNTSETMTIGRDSSCDVVITAPFISREHLLIKMDGGEYYIASTGANPTFLENNGKSLELTWPDFFELEDGDTITVGDKVIARIKLPEPSAPQEKATLAEEEGPTLSPHIEIPTIVSLNKGDGVTTVGISYDQRITADPEKITAKWLEFEHISGDGPSTRGWRVTSIATGKFTINGERYEPNMRTPVWSDNDIIEVGGRELKVNVVAGNIQIAIHDKSDPEILEVYISGKGELKPGKHVGSLEEVYGKDGDEIGYNFKDQNGGKAVLLNSGEIKMIHKRNDDKKKNDLNAEYIHPDLLGKAQFQQGSVNESLRGKMVVVDFSHEKLRVLFDKHIDTIKNKLGLEWITKEDAAIEAWKIIKKEVPYDTGESSENILYSLGAFRAKDVCNERGMLLQIVLQYLGIESRMEKGQVQGGRHAWVRVTDDDVPEMLLDPQMNDPITEDDGFWEAYNEIYSDDGTPFAKGKVKTVEIDTD